MSSRPYCLLGAVLCLLSAFGYAADDIVRSSAGVNAVLMGPPTGRQHFDLTGLVTYVTSPIPLGKHSSCVLEDASGRISLFNFCAHLCTNKLQRGDVARVRGWVEVTPQREPWMVCYKALKIGSAATAPDIRTSIDELNSEKTYLRNITTEATVVDVFRDEIDPGYDYMLVKDGSTTIATALPHADGNKELVDARVEIKGLFRNFINGQRKFAGPCIFIEKPVDVRVLTPPPADPFDFPTLEQLIYISPAEVAQLGKRSIVGTVLATWQKSHLLLRAGDGRTISVELSKGESLPQHGQLVTAVGYPTTDLFRINLSRAKVRVETGAPTPDEEPETSTADKLLLDENGNERFNSELIFGKLVTLNGILRALPAEGTDDRRLLLDCGRFKIPVDYSSNPTAADGLSLGSEIEVSGRCLLEIDKWQPSDIFPHITGLSLVIRRPDDIRVVHGPSLWTPQRLSVVIGLLLAVLLGLYARNRFQKRLARLKLGERTRLAVELHDSLSQTLAGIACQIAASDNAIGDDPVTAKDRIKTAERMLKSCRTELRHCLFDLRSDTLEEKDFSAALRKTLDQLEGDADIAVRFNVPRTLLDDAIAHTIITIVRELTGNALRHGGATKVRIAGSVEDGCVRFSVADNGCGFDPARCAGSLEGHFGLEGIRDRMKKLRGTFEINSAPGKGAKAILTIPLSSNAK